MINNLQRALVLKRLPKIDISLDDPNDIFLAAMALASEAEYLVTGDGRAGLLQQKRIGCTKIITPSKFCTRVLEIS